MRFSIKVVPFVCLFEYLTTALAEASWLHPVFTTLCVKREQKYGTYYRVKFDHWHFRQHCSHQTGNVYTVQSGVKKPEVPRCSVFIKLHHVYMYPGMYLCSGRYTYYVSTLLWPIPTYISTVYVVCMFLLSIVALFSLFMPINL